MIRAFARPVRSITSEEIDRSLAGLDRDGLAPAPTDKHRLGVGQVLGYAIEQGWRALIP